MYFIPFLCLVKIVGISDAELKLTSDAVKGQKRAPSARVSELTVLLEHFAAVPPKESQQLKAVSGKKC